MRSWWQSGPKYFQVQNLSFFPKIILKKIWVNAFLNQLNPMYLTIYTYSAFGA